MTQKLKLTTLLLLVASISFAQNVQKTDTTKNPPKPQAIAAKDKGDIIWTKLPSKPVKKPTHMAALDSAQSVSNGTKPQAMTEQVNPAIKGVGVVVKKNPGGGANITVAPTNEKGETEVTFTEKGNYIFTLTNPVKPNSKTLNTLGVGVQGVKIGLGKNPSGAIIKTSTPNEKGEVEFKDLEIGSYKILIMQGERTVTANPVKQN